MTKNNSSDELVETFRKSGVPKIHANSIAQFIKATHFSKQQVLEAIGEDEKLLSIQNDPTKGAAETTLARNKEMIKRNYLRHKIKSKLGLGD